MQPDPGSRFERLFTGRTIRIDTNHGGQQTSEWIRLDGVTREGPWTGESSTNPPFYLGDYRCRLQEAETGSVLFTCGYSSFFDEWRSTSAARSGEEASFSESLRIPEPKGNARLVIEGRTREGAFRKLFEVPLRRSEIRDAGPVAEAESIDVSITGDAAHSVNMLFVAEGYVEGERNKFVDDVRRISESLFQVEPYKSRKHVFNVRALFAPSNESGISDPTKNRRIDTFFNATFDVFGIARYLLTFDNRKLRASASRTPYDCLIVLCNTETYGGGGVFNQYACIAADAPHGQYLIAHELGHSLTGLADEYYTSQVTYDVEKTLPWEPWNRNVTTRPDRATLKWGHLVEPDVPLPTPWERQRYDEIAERVRRATDSGKAGVDQARDLADQMTTLLESSLYHGRVGAFEGAIYRATGAYRPEVDCLMFSRSHSRFCRVCLDAITTRIEELTRPRI